MNYIDKTPKGLVTSKNVVKLYDIVQPRKDFWKDKKIKISAKPPVLCDGRFTVAEGKKALLFGKFSRIIN